MDGSEEFQRGLMAQRGCLPDMLPKIEWLFKVLISMIKLCKFTLINLPLYLGIWKISGITISHWSKLFCLHIL